MIGFNELSFQREIVDEFERLRQCVTVKLIHSMVVCKDGDGDLEVPMLRSCSAAKSSEFTH